MSQISEIGNYQDMFKCAMDEKKYEKECAKVVGSWLMKGGNKALK